jgi:hypothetical protein
VSKRKLAKWGLVTVLVLFGLAMIGSLFPEPPVPQADRNAKAGPIFVPDPRGVALAKLLSLEDFSGYLAGKKVVGDWATFEPIDVRATARQIFRTYTDNEVAGDEKFKGKAIAVTGTTIRVGKDISGDIYLLLEGGGLITNVQAFLADETLAEADQLRPGRPIQLICQGDGMTLAFPMLKDCQSSDVLLQVKRAQIDDTVDQVLNGTGSNISDKLKLLIGYAYSVGTALPEGNPCETATIDDMAACKRTMHTISREYRDTLYMQLARKLNLPPLPSR